MLRDPGLRTGLALSTLVSTVIMATLVVGPFYLTRALGLDAASTGFVLSAGPLVAALTGMPAGRVVDRFGAQRTTYVGLAGMTAGSLGLAAAPAALGIPGYVVPLVVMTAGYALFQTANNTGVMTGVHPDRRGVISGMLSLSRNLGLVTGASVMAALFAIAASGAGVTTTAAPAAAASAAVASGMRLTFAVAAMLTLGAMAISMVWSRSRGTGRIRP
jgi:MFS family permease